MAGDDTEIYFVGCAVPDPLKAAAPVIRCESIGAIDRDASLVVAEMGVAGVGQAREALQNLRQRCPEALIVGFVPLATGAREVDDLVLHGFDHVASGPRQLLRVVGAELRLRVLKKSHDHLLRRNRGVVELLDQIAARPDLHDVLRTCVMRLGDLFDMAGVGAVLFDSTEDIAYVVTPGDADPLSDFRLQIADYPELTAVAAGTQPVEASLQLSARLSRAICRDGTSTAPSHPGMLFPLMRKQRALGAILLCPHLARRSDISETVELGTLVASITSVSIGNALAQDELIEAQRELLRDQERVGRQLESLKTFSDIFERAFDGILVTDPAGCIRYANDAAGAVLQKRPEQLKGLLFSDLLNPRSHLVTERAYKGDSVGDAYGYVDLLVPDAFGSDTVISAAIRPVEEEAAVLVSFRDVTELREIESELRQTKDFLENLIQSSVDAIVAADVDGRIILFNRSAENILGYAARDVVGKMTIAQLYPVGESEDVQRRLRSDAYGGRGRLEQLRKDLVAKNGERVPCRLTAAVIYEDQGESATVCVFTDLRESLRLESKLNQVQQRLRMSERQSVAMELAGTAAHELNQPLTSILGYAEILRRSDSTEEMNKKAAAVIGREVERMAAIVKKIGEITAYDPKPYVGDSRILDLDRRAHGPDDGGSSSDEPAS